MWRHTQTALYCLQKLFESGTPHLALRISCTTEEPEACYLRGASADRAALQLSALEIPGSLCPPGLSGGLRRATSYIQADSRDIFNGSGSPGTP